MILVCGRNEKLANDCARQSGICLCILGFTREVNRLMHAADFLIGKPGPGACRSHDFGLAGLVECNSSTLPQEHYNTQWVIEKQVGVVIRSFANVVPAVRSLMEPGRLSELQRNVKAQKNRAVFEIPEFLSSLLREKTDSSAELPVEVKVGN